MQSSAVCPSAVLFRPGAQRFTTRSPKSAVRSKVVKPARHAVSVRAVMSPEDAPRTMKDESTGIEFPLVDRLGMVEQRCLGVGQRKTPFLLGLFSSNAYSVAMYVDPEPCARELSLRERGGLDLTTEEALSDALLDGAFMKALQIVPCKQMTGEEFVESILEALAPRMRLTGGMPDLQKFAAIFDQKVLVKGCEVSLVWHPCGELEAAIHEPLDQTTLLSIDSEMLCRGLFEAFLGQNTLSETVKHAAAEGAAMLLESDNVRRDWAHRSIITEKAEERDNWDH